MNIRNQQQHLYKLPTKPTKTTPLQIHTAFPTEQKTATSNTNLQHNYFKNNWKYKLPTGPTTAN
jgi:hypothetical protein